MTFKQLKNKLICFWKGHKKIYVGSELPLSQQNLYYCPRCNSFFVWHFGIACGYRESDINRLPKKMQKSARAFLEEFRRVSKDEGESKEARSN